MSFIDLSLPERERFLKSSTRCHIPGYTGHCPTIKFLYGKGFGANTREIMQNLRDRPLALDMKPYKQDYSKVSSTADLQKKEDEECDPAVFLNLPKRPYILGYTGFIPGYNFRYGSSFAVMADESMDEFTKRLFQEKKKREKDRFEYSIMTRKMTSERNKDEMSRLLHDNSNRTSRKQGGSFISFALPPIAGYTGHIPRLIDSETSLSQRYHTAAKAGIAKLNEDKSRQHYIEMAKEAVANAIACSHTTR